MTSLPILAAALAGAAVAGPRPILVFNEDNSAYFFPQSRHGHELSEAGLRRYLGDIAGGGRVTHFFMCPNAMCCNFDSKVMTTTWDAIARPGVKVEVWQRGVAAMHEKGIDPYAVWADECRKRGVSPWLSIRMNDAHCANMATNAMHSAFWLAHPEFRRVPGWTDGWDLNCGALDYAHREVRKYWKSFLAEAFARYDVDGVELDWMRFGYNLTPGRERELSGCLDEIVCEARRLADAAAKRLGHAVKVGVRLPTRPDEALRRGNDYVKWANEGWIDWVIPCNLWWSADFGLPYAEWVKSLAHAKRPVTVVPGTDCGIRDGKRRREMTVNEYAVFADRVYRQGAPGIYLFNFFDHPGSNGVWKAILSDGLPPDRVSRLAVGVTVPTEHD